MVTKGEFQRYLRVQHSGKFNMYDQRARMATGLSSEKYLYIIKNYKELKHTFEKENQP